MPEDQQRYVFRNQRRTVSVEPVVMRVEKKKHIEEGNKTIKAYIDQLHFTRPETPNMDPTEDNSHIIKVDHAIIDLSKNLTLQEFRQQEVVKAQYAKLFLPYKFKRRFASLATKVNSIRSPEDRVKLAI